MTRGITLRVKSYQRRSKRSDCRAGRRGLVENGDLAVGAGSTPDDTVEMADLRPAAQRIHVLADEIADSTKPLRMKVSEAMDMAIALSNKAVAIAECNSTPSARKTGISTNAAPTPAMESTVVSTKVTTAAIASISKQPVVFVDFLLLTEAIRLIPQLETQDRARRS